VFGILGRFDHDCHADPGPVALVVGLLKNQVQAAFPHPCYPLRPQPDVPDAINRSVIQHQQTTLRASIVSTSAMDYSLPRLRTKFGQRAFSHTGPSTIDLKRTS